MTGIRGGPITIYVRRCRAVPVGGSMVGMAGRNGSWWRRGGKMAPAAHGGVNAASARQVHNLLQVRDVFGDITLGSAGEHPSPEPVGTLVGELTDPFTLEVHRPVRAGDADLELDALPAYVPREHDARLAVTVRAAAEGRSGIAALVGGSSTGKTRACWEALGSLPEGWRLWHPIDPTRPGAALRDLGRLGPRTVVWLNEAQFYLADPSLGEQVAAGLRESLRDPDRGPVLVLATLWPEHWATLTSRPVNGGDPHAQARELLEGHRIPVPGAFTGTDLLALAEQADPRLAEAAERAGDGQVTQYLAGVPVLLDRYETASPATRAMVHAAMDARRLGAGPHLPLPLLADAVPGYLTGAEWDRAGDDWPERSLAYAAEPCNGVDGILTRVRPRPGDPPDAAPMYRLADYLDQHGRGSRAGEVPPTEFWTALADHLDPADLRDFADAAVGRGMYRDGARLYLRAAAHGDLEAGSSLVKLMHKSHPGDPRPARWVVASLPDEPDFDNPIGVVLLVWGLRDADAGREIDELADRIAARVPLTNTRVVAELLDCLCNAGADRRAIAALADRATQASLSDTTGVLSLLASLRKVKAYRQVEVLATRIAADVPLENARVLASFLGGMRQAGADAQAMALAARAAAGVPLEAPGAVAELLDALREAGADEQITTVLSSNPAGRVPITDPQKVERLLGSLRAAGAEEQIRVLLGRDLAGSVSLTSPDEPLAWKWLLSRLGEEGAGRQVESLTARAVAHLPLTDPGVVWALLYTLRKAGAGERIAALLGRDPASQVRLGDPYQVGHLLDALLEVGADRQIEQLLGRDPAAHCALITSDDPSGAWGVPVLGASLRAAGAETQIRVLAERVAQAPLDRPYLVATLVEFLHEMGTGPQFERLAGRIAAGLALDDPYSGGSLREVLTALREAGADRQADALVERLPGGGQFELFVEQTGTGDLFRYGRDPGGTSAGPWSWDDLT
ncbi:hypothetical protein [Actinoallomurus bryophytorum]|nr:hypothetical protein [Actinoallomurus bryophytorum]